MTRRRALAGLGACAGAMAVALLLAAWLTPDNVLAFWMLVSLCS